MPKKSEVPLSVRTKIITLNDLGYSQRNIARMVTLSRTTVQYVLKNYKETGLLTPKPRSGRKRKIGERETRLLKRNAIKNRRKTSKELAADLNLESGISVCPSTVRRHLVAAGIRGCKARKKPWLSQINQKRRLQWAKKHKNWTIDQWSRVVWSDETNIEVSWVGCRLVLKIYLTLFKFAIL